MKQKGYLGIFILTTVFILLGLLIIYSWTPVPVKDDQTLFMPGTQPGGAGVAETSDKCDNCHGNYNPSVEPAYNWRGSMMAQAARDPLWLACLAVSDQDAIWAVGNPNAGDICIRCHSPTGWLEGRSDPTNTSALKTTDFDGVQCDFCHRMIDPFAELRQPDVPPETDPDAEAMAEETYLKDINELSILTLFDGTLFLDPATNLPTYYGSESLPDYVENASGQYFVDPSNAKSGPFFDAKARHQMYYSRYHKSKRFCSVCHDVSNPILASVTLGMDVPEKQAAASYFHVERTTSEFLLSSYGNGGASTSIPGVPWADKCQDCHMRDVTGLGCNKRGTPERGDLPLHDLTGGNQWISRILASTDTNHPAFDSYNHKILSGQKYSGAQLELSGIRGYGQALLDGADRAVQQLQMAASLSIVSEDASSATIQVQNNTGHKLISGFPEGRRMFLNVKFFDSAGNQIDEINHYEPLVTALDPNGNETYVSGGIITTKTEELVWEAEMSSSLTGESKSFHFALATDRHKDNRIPPKGFNTAAMHERLAQPRWAGEDAPGYFTAEEYAGGYYDVTITKPLGTNSWYATLYYQTTSKEYIEFLRDEINGTATTLSSPTPSGEPQAYIIQTDPFFANLKGWGDAIWDLWLHNGGAAPVVMAQIGDAPAPPCTIDSPSNLAATPGKRSVTLNWDQVADAEGYNIYYSQGGKYTFVTSTTSTSHKFTKLSSGQTICYAVTAYKTCPDSSTAESDYSNEACATVN
ncbi:MAG: hypothetical protein GTO16_07955 [Candidatus Aminicenantes bacterium]|nr:hypothetical protein [Candidatus Aminicenantes bacterium]